MTVGKLRPLLIKQHFVFYGCTRFLNEHQSEDNSEKDDIEEINRTGQQKQILRNDDGKEKEEEEETSSKKMQNEENTR